jgi:hypothetical protein
MARRHGKVPGADVPDERGGDLAAGRARAAEKKPSCEDCFFRRRNLCALGLDEPCSTFRPDSPAGLVPPRQPSLLLRGAADAPEAARQVA